MCDEVKRLPDKPSDLIELALMDLEQIERDPRYTVDMGSWHVGDYAGSGVCHVCLAGAVMARTLGHQPSEDVYPEQLDRDAHMKLSALDLFRLGQVGLGLSAMGLSPDGYEGVEMNVAKYYRDPAQFKLDVASIVAQLRSDGL